MRLVGCNVIASSCDRDRQCSSGMHMRDEVGVMIRRWPLGVTPWVLRRGGATAGGLVYIAGNESRLRSERMHHGGRQKQVHANNKTLMNTHMARKGQLISQMDS